MLLREANCNKNNQR